MDTFTTEGKIFPRERLAQQAEIWRAQGETIVFTNGCFDLLHAGHIASLEMARSHGTLLIVGLNSDVSVRLLKGPDRPLNSEMNRARVLAALTCVGAVTIFDEETACNTLELLRPHILVKGGDYLVKPLPEREVVERYGGRIEIIPLVPGLSTSGLIDAARG